MSETDQSDPVCIPIDGDLDLHGFNPKEVPHLLQEYLTECAKREIFNGRIIHGGGGKLPKDKDLRVFNTQWLGDDVRVNFRSYGMDPDHSKKMREFGMTSGDRVDSRVYPEFKYSI